MASLLLPWLLLAARSLIVPEPERIIWQDPGAVETLDMARGAGGDRLPAAPYSFIEEITAGTSPKMTVRDANGRVWRVKFGNEAMGDVFGSRMAWACGYAADAAYFVRFGHVEGVRNPARIAPYLSNGHFRNARFALNDEGVRPVASESWRWDRNPFTGTRELNGLKVLIMLLSNWDNKDSRDNSRGSNTLVLERTANGARQWLYGLTDWGAAMGKWGGFATREKWDCRLYAEQSPLLVRRVLDNGLIEWGFHGQHTESFADDIRAEDVRWLMQYLGRISDAQIRTALEASGATQREMECYGKALRERIARLGAL